MNYLMGQAPVVPLESLSVANDAARAAQSLAWLAVIICSLALLLVIVGIATALWVANRVDNVDQRLRELENNHKGVKPRKRAVGE